MLHGQNAFPSLFRPICLRVQLSSPHMTRWSNCGVDPCRGCSERAWSLYSMDKTSSTSNPYEELWRRPERLRLLRTRPPLSFPFFSCHSVSFCRCLIFCPVLSFQSPLPHPHAADSDSFSCRSDNSLGKKGGTAVAEALGRLTALTDLDLG